MWLPTNIAWMCAAALGLVTLVLRGVPVAARRERASRVVVVAQEAAILFALYALWRFLGDQTLMSTDGAMARGHAIWTFERSVHLPNEVRMQQVALHSTPLIRFANTYYIVAHVLPLGIWIVWLFFRHRDRYAPWRNLLAFGSLVCLAIQYVPVAPPRFFPELGFVDTAAKYGPRVYDSIGTNLPGQLSAMPSMHMAWAILIGVSAWQVSTSRWRWIGPGHTLLMLMSVTITAYHWLADSLVAGAVLLLGAGLWRWWARWQQRRRADGAQDAAGSLDPVDAAGSAVGSDAPEPLDAVGAAGSGGGSDVPEPPDGPTAPAGASGTG